MKPGVELATERLSLRHWRDDDLDVLHRLNADEQVMRFFPFRRDRAQTIEMLGMIRQRIAEDGIGWAAVCLRANGAVIGFAGLARTRMGLAFEPAVEIGWRILPEHWRRGYASEAARELLRHGFEDIGLDEIVSFAVHDNHASTGVMRSIGMARDAAFDFDHPQVPDDRPELKRHVFYRLKRDDWRRTVNQSR